MLVHIATFAELLFFKMKPKERKVGGKKKNKPKKLKSNNVEGE